MNIIVSNASDKPIYEQIYSQIKALIIKGVLQEGDALPSMRVLAKELRISVITTKRAYEELEKDRFILSVAGKGSYVAPKNTELIREENLKKIESLANEMIELAKLSGVGIDELMSTIKMTYEED